MDALALIVALLALALGLAAGWIWARGRAAAEAAAAAGTARAELERLAGELAAAKGERDKLAAEYGAWRASVEQHRKTEEQALREIEARFALLSKSALKDNSEQFNATSGKALADMLQPFREKLDKLETETKAIEKARTDAYAGLNEKLGALQQATSTLHDTSHALATALKGDGRARGRWGEVALRNVAEFAGMTRHCDFCEQETADDGSRPDMIVNMPGGDGRIPIDAKVPMDAYMTGVEATDPDVRRAALVKHAADMRKHVRILAGRDYAQSLGSRVDYTVMFIPAEPVLAAAFEADPSLQQDAMEKRVLLATPVTLLALLRTVALYWQQARMADDARACWDAARELHARIKVFADHLGGVHKGLSRALESWDKAVGSYESRVLPQGRRLEELALPAASADATLPALEAIGRAPRVIDAPPAAATPPAVGSPTPLLDRTLGAS